jgi:hypothetical protein
MMLRVLPAVALLLTVAGCGSGGSASSPGDAVRSYNAAVAAGDGERACERLDKAAQDELRQSTQGAIRSSCPDVIDALAGFYDDATKERLRETKVETRSDGDSAIATFASPVALGGPDRRATYELERVDGDWKIASLGIGAGGVAGP